MRAIVALSIEISMRRKGGQTQQGPKGSVVTLWAYATTKLASGAKPAHHPEVICGLQFASFPDQVAVLLQAAFSSRCVMGGVPETDYCIGLGTLLTLNDVELHVIALFQSFIAVQLDCRIVNEHVWSVFTPDESVALGVVKPLDLTFVLSHRLPPSLHLS